MTELDIDLPVDSTTSAEQATGALAGAAKEGGSRDDVTVVVARFEEGE